MEHDADVLGCIRTMPQEPLVKKIFLAFPGFDVTVLEKFATSGEIQVWNLKQIDIAEFSGRLDESVPVVNRSTRKDIFIGGDAALFAKAYDASAWGILLPDPSGDNLSARYVSYLLMCLYSSTFLPITFYVSVLGISIELPEVQLGMAAQFHEEDQKFLSKDFNFFYRELFSVVADTQWDSRAVLAWSQEQWRLCMASILFMDLSKYQYSKQVLTWPKECAEIVTIYETLLSRRDHDNGAAFMLQRIEVILGGHFEKQFADKRDGLRRLFGYRNDFIHGDFFRRLARETKPYSGSDIADLPAVEFNFLRMQTRMVCLVFACILRLGAHLHEFAAYDASIRSVQDAVERAIMDVDLRAKIQYHCESLLGAMPAFT